MRLGLCCLNCCLACFDLPSDVIGSSCAQEEGFRGGEKGKEFQGQFCITIVRRKENWQECGFLLVKFAGTKLALKVA